jgi:2-polyprenyl-6-methoxyphenol hydroxylase-like FAD-dependent oxidoreductase
LEDPEMTETASAPRRRAIVIGGSLGGLFAGNMLRLAGWDVDISERSPHDLDSRGGGIVLQPEVVRLFERTGVDTGAMDLGVASRDRIVYRPDGSIQSRQLAPQTQTSWSLIYSTMKRAFGEEHYHQGKRLTGVRQDAATRRVTAKFDDGSSVTGDLLIGADGGSSMVRALLWPGIQPTYAGYVAWRGLVPEDEMPPVARAGLHGHFGFSNNHHSHILGYLVPGDDNDTRKGRRLYNWVWYRTVERADLDRVMTDAEGRARGSSVPEGLLAPEWRERIRRDADTLLPPVFRAVVQATRAPFAQAIRDSRVETMVRGRVVLLGDAAFIPRPHTAASTSKAAANALALGDALLADDDIDRALARWQPAQLQLGNALYARGRDIGNYLLFHRPPVARIG